MKYSKRTRATTVPEEVVHQTRAKLAEDGIELTFEEVDKRLRNIIDKTRESMNSKGFPFPNDDYNAIKLMKLVMMGN